MSCKDSAVAPTTTPVSNARLHAKPIPPMKRAFTLVELLVTVAIIIALAAITIPTARYGIARARASACTGKLRSIGIAVEAYLQDHNDLMPDLETARSTREEDLPVIETVLDEYLPVPDAFHCPADHVEFARSGCSYLWNNTQSGLHKLKLSFFGVDGDPRSIPLVTDKEAWHPGEDGVNILYADYHTSNRVEFRAAPSPE